MVDARLLDGSRVNAIIPPLADRRPRPVDPPLRIELLRRRLAGHRTKHSPGVADIAGGCRASPHQMLISGGTGAGKTTSFNILSRFIPRKERSSQSKTRQNCSYSSRTRGALETRPPNIEGRAKSTSATWSSTACVCVPTA